MYFTVNTAFLNYLDNLDNLTDSLKFLILMNRPTFEQTLPSSLNLSKFNSKLQTAPMTLKDFVHQYHHKREIFDLQERHTVTELKMPNTISFSKIIIEIFFCLLLL